MYTRWNMIIQMIATIKRSSGSASSSKFINQHSDCSHGVAALSNFLQHNIWTPIKPNRTNKSTRRSTHTKRKRKKIMCKLIAASCRCLGSMNQRRELGTTRNRSHPNGLAFQASSRPRNHTPPPPPTNSPPHKKNAKNREGIDRSGARGGATGTSCVALPGPWRWGGRWIAGRWAPRSGGGGGRCARARWRWPPRRTPAPPPCTPPPPSPSRTGRATSPLPPSPHPRQRVGPAAAASAAGALGLAPVWCAFGCEWLGKEEEEEEKGVNSARRRCLICICFWLRWLDLINFRLIFH